MTRLLKDIEDEINIIKSMIRSSAERNKESRIELESWTQEDIDASYDDFWNEISSEKEYVAKNIQSLNFISHVLDQSSEKLRILYDKCNEKEKSSNKRKRDP